MPDEPFAELFADEPCLLPGDARPDGVQCSVRGGRALLATEEPAECKEGGEKDGRGERPVAGGRASDDACPRFVHSRAPPSASSSASVGVSAIVSPPSGARSVMSLSRAFAYAGVPSTVVSLWPASDKSTPELMKFFYQNLKDGQTKDVALNNARKQYLATATGKARHPFYWGGFVMIGENSPISQDRNTLFWIVPILILLVFIRTIYNRKRK